MRTEVLQTAEPLVAPADPIAAVATALVDSGRVVPGLTVDADGRARGWWWPLPAAEDRPAIRALLSDSEPSTHAAVAAALAEAVDALVRSRLVGTALPRRPGRRTLPEL